MSSKIAAARVSSATLRVAKLCALLDEMRGLLRRLLSEDINAEERDNICADITLMRARVVNMFSIERIQSLCEEVKTELETDLKNSKVLTPPEELILPN